MKTVRKSRTTGTFKTANMSKKEAKKCKCKGKQKCEKCFHFGTYYIVGVDRIGKKLTKLICTMTMQGINVYHFASGKPGGCPPGGCH